MIKRMKTNEMGSITSATSVISQLMEIIMTSTPMMVTTELMIWERFWVRVVLMVSTSLVTRLSTSP